MSISEKKKEISRSGFRTAFKECNPIAPGTAQKLFTTEERKEIEKKLFGKRLDGLASQEKYKKVVTAIGGKKYEISDISKREIIDKKIKILKEIKKVAISMEKKPKNSKTDFFGKKGYLTRSEFRERLRKASPFTRGFSGMMRKEERVKVEGEIFGRKYGQLIEKKDYSTALKELKKAEYKTRNPRAKREIRKKISFLKGLSGL